MSKIRICLNLSCFFNDHRQQSRIFINDDIETIKDLKKYIVSVFGIKKFYLLCENYYLLPANNIRVLNNDDVVFVVPVNKVPCSSCENVPKDKSEIKKSKPKLGKNATEVELQSGEMEICSPVNVVEKIPESKKTKTSKKKKRSLSPMLEQNNLNVDETTPNENKKLKKSKKSTSTTPCPTKIVETNESNDVELNSVLPRKSCEQSVRKTLENVQEITEQPVEKNTAEQSNGCLDLPPRKNKTIYVEDTVLNISNTTDTSILNQNEKNNSVQKWNCKNWIPPLVDVIQMCKTTNESVDISNNEETTIGFVTKRRRNRVRPRKRKRLENGDSELDSSQSESTIFRPLKSRAAPVSHIKFTEDVEDFGTEQNSHEDETNVGNNSSTLKQFLHSTPHNKHVNSHNDTEIESPLPAVNNVNNRSNDKREREKQIDLSKVQLKPLLNGQPVVGNVLLFQRLKLGNDYSPQISKTILAEVKEVSKDGNQLTLKVLDGHEEFEEPRGKFSCIPENDDDEEEEEGTNNITLIETVHVDKNALIDAKIVIN